MSDHARNAAVMTPPRVAPSMPYHKAQRNPGLWTGLQERVASLESKIDCRLAALEARFDMEAQSNTSRMKAVQDPLAGVIEDVAGLRSREEEIKVKVVALQTHCTTSEESIMSLQSTVCAMDGRQFAAETKCHSIAADVQELKTALAEQASQKQLQHQLLQGLQQSVSEHRAEVMSKQEQHEAAINKLQVQCSRCDEALALLQANVAGMDNRFVSAEVSREQAASLHSQLASAQVKQEQLDVALSEMATWRSTCDTSLSAMKGEVSAVAARSDGFDAQLQGLRVEVQEARVALGKLECQHGDADRSLQELGQRTEQLNATLHSCVAQWSTSMEEGMRAQQELWQGQLHHVAQSLSADHVLEKERVSALANSLDSLRGCEEQISSLAKNLDHLTACQERADAALSEFKTTSEARSEALLKKVTAVMQIEGGVHKELENLQAVVSDRGLQLQELRRMVMDVNGEIGLAREAQDQACCCFVEVVKLRAVQQRFSSDMEEAVGTLALQSKRINELDEVMARVDASRAEAAEGLSSRISQLEVGIGNVKDEAAGDSVTLAQGVAKVTASVKKAQDDITKLQTAPNQVPFMLAMLDGLSNMQRETGLKVSQLGQAAAAMEKKMASLESQAPPDQDALVALPQQVRDLKNAVYEKVPDVLKAMSSRFELQLGTIRSEGERHASHLRDLQDQVRAVAK